MGESIAARTNQLAYYVPERYVVKVESGESTLLKLKWNDAKNVKIGEKEYPIGESDYAASIHVDPVKLDGWLNVIRQSACNTAKFGTDIIGCNLKISSVIEFHAHLTASFHGS